MADEERAPKRMGRPRKYASDAKRPTLTFRVRDGLYEKLKTSAEDRQKSISEEIERRLELSFRDFDVLSMFAASEKNAELLYFCMTALRFIELRYKSDWTKDESLSRMVSHCIGYIAARMGIGGIPGLKDISQEELAKALAISRSAIRMNINGSDPADEVAQIEVAETEGVRFVV